MKREAEPLTAQAFAPFGQVLEMPSDTPRLDHAADLVNGRPGARPNLAMIRAPAASLPLHATLLERHPYSTQAFVPLDAQRYLLLVCVDDGRGHPDLATARAFIARWDQAINYHANVWHHSMAALDRAGIFAMLIWEDGSIDDCQFASIAAITVEAPRF